MASVEPSTDETPSEEETTTQPSTDEEEEDIDINIPFADGQPETGDTSNVATYVMLLLVAAIGGAVAFFSKKDKANE